MVDTATALAADAFLGAARAAYDAALDAHLERLTWDRLGSSPGSAIGSAPC